MLTGSQHLLDSAILKGNQEGLLWTFAFGCLDSVSILLAQLFLHIESGALRYIYTAWSYVIMSLFVQISLGREEDGKPDSCVMCDRAKCCRLLESLWTALQMTSVGTVLLLSLSVKSLHTWMSEIDFIKTIKHNSHTLSFSLLVYLLY